MATNWLKLMRTWIASEPATVPTPSSPLVWRCQGYWGWSHLRWDFLQVSMRAGTCSSHTAQQYIWGVATIV